MKKKCFPTLFLQRKKTILLLLYSQMHVEYLFGFQDSTWTNRQILIITRDTKTKCISKVISESNIVLLILTLCYYYRRTFPVERFTNRLWFSSDQSNNCLCEHNPSNVSDRFSINCNYLKNYSIIICLFNGLLIDFNIKKVLLLRCKKCFHIFFR